MFEKGTVKVFGKTYEYSAKRYEAASRMGMFGGCVSKLDIMRNGRRVLSYDRGFSSPVSLLGLIAARKICD